ncbi:glyoxylase-like metal-dependent hydrolase (beta-lactamase superfamily II) [Clostridium algifaecis]|uniref:Glyoxylase-like metal-dependent hydrolase (Beta-lactamase superfamily II) n=1 Tax=Clostridium algifaecis TaxID=1472040 RepID=A0ABS4KUQ7_9CLOT|nr:MBL fold metallo-hydrolase [Clostridium algifaecis]MBP2033335.1 glyoxylase-like metal-dependent hydrolase (beta-lactamase superfamily II) [Clostridium algifaecis]
MKKLLLHGEIPVNCYFIVHNNKCYIVDPGYEKEKLLNYVKTNNLEVLGILLTHGHIDHIGAIDCFDLPVYLHKDEYEILCDNHKNGFEFYGREKTYSLNDINIVKIDETTVLPLGDKNIKVIHTPGHTIGSVCYKIDDDLYTGDTLFKEAVGKWTFPTGDLDTLKRSIIHLIDRHKNFIRIHPAHGESSTIEYEKQFNYFYKIWKNEKL